MNFELPPSFWPTLYRLSTGSEWPPVSAEEAAPFLARVVREGLLSLLLAEPEVPPAVAQAAHKYEALDRTNRIRARAFEDSVRAMLDVIGDEPVIVLKGIDYAYRLYPAPHLRPRQDVDVLVKSESAKAVAARLEKAGYERHFPAGAVARLPTYHEAVFVVGNATIEVHHSFIQRTRNRIDYRGVWQRAKPWSGFDRRLLQLDEIDGVIYHAINMNSDEFSTPMFRHLDFWLLLHGRDEILPDAVVRARQWATKRALYGALRQTSRYFPQFATPAVERAMHDLLPHRARAFLDRSILPDPFGPRKRYGRAGQLWRKFWLIDDFRHRAVFLLYHAYALAAGALLSLRASRQGQHAEEEARQNQLEADAEKQARGNDQAKGRGRIQ